MSAELNSLYDQLREADRLAQSGDAEAQADAQAIYAEIQRIESASAETPGKETTPFAVAYAPYEGALVGGIAGAAKGPDIAKSGGEFVQPLVKKVPGQGVRNYIEATTNRPYAGGDAYDTAFLKAKIAAGQPVKSRGSEMPIRRGGLSINTQPVEPTFLQNTARRVVSEPANVPSRVGSALRYGAAGSLGGKAAQDIYNKDYGQATLHGAGALAALAGQSRYKPLRYLGNLVTAGEVASGVYDAIPKTAEQKAAGGKIKGGLDFAKKAFTPAETKIVRASEALAPHEGKWLNTTQSDRMRSTGGDLGGPGFSRFQQVDPAYKNAAWGVGKQGTASAIVNTNKRYPEGQAIWAPMIGSETQHHSNQHVYDALTSEFNRQAAMGKLTPELREKMNAYLMTNKEYAPFFKEGVDVGNPEALAKLGDTFDRRGAISNVISGKGVGGQKGQIFDYPGIMQEMTDPMTIGAPTHSVGTRLFSLNNEIEHRPDLHSAFPYILKGEDQGVAFTPVPKELAIPDWMGLVRDFKGREPGYMDYTRGLKGKGTPFQFIDEQYLRALEAAGHKAGGLIDGYAGGGDIPKSVVKAYKLFKKDAEGNLFPLFVNANKPVPVGEWLKAEAGPLTEAGKVKSKIGDLAYRPGWHSGEFPVATHIGGKSAPDLKAPDYRLPEQVWAEVEHPADIDWQSIANARAQLNKAGKPIPRTAHITEEVPFGGHYRYKTNPNMTGDWLISGDMKVNRVLSDEEVQAINEAAGVADLPRFTKFDK